MYRHALAAEEVAGQGDHAHRVGMVLRADEAHVRAAGAVLRLDRVAAYRTLAHRPLADGEVDVGRFLRLEVVVVLDVVADDLDVAHLTAVDLQPALLAVADVVAVDVDLVQVHAVEEDPYAAVVINVAVGDEDVAVAVGEVDAVTAAADQHTLEGRLHRPLDADAVGRGVAADDLQVLHRRHPLLAPDALGEG